jgi:hypothetical protein
MKNVLEKYKHLGIIELEQVEYGLIRKTNIDVVRYKNKLSK